MKIRVAAGDTYEHLRELAAAARSAFADRPAAIPVSHPRALANIAPGHRVAINDGKIAGVVEAVSPRSLLVRVTYPDSPGQHGPHPPCRARSTRLWGHGCQGRPRRGSRLRRPPIRGRGYPHDVRGCSRPRHLGPAAPRNAHAQRTPGSSRDDRRRPWPACLLRHAKQGAACHTCMRDPRGSPCSRRPPPREEVRHVPDIHPTAWDLHGVRARSPGPAPFPAVLREAQSP